MAEGAEDVPVVYLHDIKREYRQGEATLTVLNGAKLALWPGQSVALVAPSGSGKSTLLHIAGLLESPDEGEVYVAGTPTSQMSDGVLGARERHAAADDSWPQALRNRETRDRDTGLSRAR